MKKTVIFHVLVLAAILSAVSMPMVTSMFVFSVSVLGLYFMTKDMTTAEIYEVSGANFYSKLFNTNDFTKE